MKSIKTRIETYHTVLCHRGLFHLSRRMKSIKTRIETSFKQSGRDITNLVGG